MSIKQKVSYPTDNLEDFIAEVLLKEVPHAISEAMKFVRLHGNDKKRVVKEHILAIIRNAGGSVEVYEKLVEGAIQVAFESKAFKTLRKKFFRLVSKCTCRKVQN